MSARRTSRKSGVFRGILSGPNRFRQVQRSLRRESRMRFPLHFYGRSDILTKEQWKRVIERYNPADLMESLNKVDMKEILAAAGISIPDTYMILETEDDLEGFRTWLDSFSDGFVIKPASGHGGAGIMVIDRRVVGRFITISGRGIGPDQLIAHVRRIIKGAYTRSVPDRAIVERRLVLSGSLRELRTPGLLDIRVVVLKGFPLMAMTRIPTRRSRGRANIHQGAIGAGISISEGRITSATLMRRNVSRHPQTGRYLIGFRFNMWEDILESASLAADASGLGFVGVDLTVDRDLGVTVIEVNKRPGLEIQNANRSGLRRRIRFLEGQIRKSKGNGNITDLGPGIKVELTRKWDTLMWRKMPEKVSEE